MLKQTNTKQNDVLKALLQGEKVSAELAEISPRYGSYIQRLRKKGFVIRTRRVTKEQFAYKVLATV